MWDTNFFCVYSKLYKFNKNEDQVFLKKCCTLLDVCNSHNDMDLIEKSRGLAAYMPDEAKKYVKSISYSGSQYKGYIEFFVRLQDGYKLSSVVTLDGEEQTLKKYACDFISGQISDGWGENGVYVIEGGWIGDKAIHCYCTETLYEKDFAKSKELESKATGEEVIFTDFNEYPAFKEVTFNKSE